jgi:hypothetical protein
MRGVGSQGEERVGLLVQVICKTKRMRRDGYVWEKGIF